MYYSQTHYTDIDFTKLRRNNLSFVQQDAYFQKGTIRYNLSLAGVGENEIATTIMPLMDFAENIPEKLDFIINPKNTSLSGGEKQRIVLTRGFLKSADIMIFDEPTNALDEESVGVFMNEIIKKKKSKIVIIVSHDIRLGKIADEVINF